MLSYLEPLAGYPTMTRRRKSSQNRRSSGCAKAWNFSPTCARCDSSKNSLDSSSIKPAVLAGTDLVVVRELTGGLYYGHLEPPVAGKPSEIRQTERGTEAIDTLLYTEAEIERIVRVAFDTARERRKKVTSVDKANVLSSSVLWRNVANRVAADYPDVTLEHLLVDAARCT